MYGDQYRVQLDDDKTYTERIVFVVFIGSQSINILRFSDNFTLGCIQHFGLRFYFRNSIIRGFPRSPQIFTTFKTKNLKFARACASTYSVKYDYLKYKKIYV